tara:strand:- start:145 stop:642 length:498 start_codon:yes stop_codon:yes gene_type:complete
MKLAMVTFAAAVGSANAYTPLGTQFDYGNPCMVKCNEEGNMDEAEFACTDACPGGKLYVEPFAACDALLVESNTVGVAALRYPGPVPLYSEMQAALATANAALATATTCMAATPGYSPANFEDNCDMKECDQWTCETWCTCYSEADAAIYTRLGCDTVDDVPCQC